MIESLLKLIKTLLFDRTWLAILIFLAIFSKLNYKRYRGFMGEFWVKRELNKLPKDEYFVLNDIMIFSNNNSHQIDHIVISKYGIFAIEMKNFYGYIIGNEYNNKWTLRMGGYKKHISNPIHQNYGHIQALKEVLNINEDIFISIVCFSNQARLNIESKSIVVQLDGLKEVILSYKEKTFNEDFINIKDKLLELNIVDKKQRKEHVKKIKNNIKDQNIKINNMICPKCNGALVERNGKFGSFIGCSNFPKCRYIKK